MIIFKNEVRKQISFGYRFGEAWTLDNSRYKTLVIFLWKWCVVFHIKKYPTGKSTYNPDKITYSGFDGLIPKCPDENVIDVSRTIIPKYSNFHNPENGNDV